MERDYHIYEICCDSVSAICRMYFDTPLCMQTRWRMEELIKGNMINKNYTWNERSSGIETILSYYWLLETSNDMIISFPFLKLLAIDGRETSQSNDMINHFWQLEQHCCLINKTWWWPFKFTVVIWIPRCSEDDTICWNAASFCHSKVTTTLIMAQSHQSIMKIISSIIIMKHSTSFSHILLKETF